MVKATWERAWLGVAVAAGVGAAATAWLGLRAQRTPPIEMVRILIASHDLDAGTAIDPARDLVAIDCPGTLEKLLALAIRADDAGSLSGVPVGMPIPAGLPVMYPHLARAERLSLGPGMVAFSLSLDRAAGVSGLVGPGSTVDIIAITAHPSPAIPSPDASPESLGKALLDMAASRELGSEVVARGVRVIAVGGKLDASEAPGDDSVTLEAPESQARDILSRCAGAAHVRLLLRSTGSPGAIDAGGSS